MGERQDPRVLFSRQGADPARLHKFFLGQFEVRSPKATAVGLPRGVTAVKTLQLKGKASNYLVAKTPEMQLGKGHFGEVFRGLELKNEMFLRSRS